MGGLAAPMGPATCLAANNMISVRDSIRIPGRVRVVYWLLALNALAFLAGGQLMVHSGDPLTGEGMAYHIFQVGGVIPADFWSPDLIDAQYGEALRQIRPPGVIAILWSMFLHASFFHLLSNCLVLLIFGPNVEAYYGRARFLFFYFSCGAVGALCQILYDLNSTIPIIGASGAISGLFGAYFALFHNHDIRITIGRYYRGYYRDILIPVKVIVIVWAVMELMNTLLAAPGQAQRIAYFTHLGGFLCGFLMSNGRGGIGGSRRRRFKVFQGGRAG